MNFLHKDSYQEQICAWFCVAWCAQSRPDSPRVVMGKFGWFEGSLATFQIIVNVKLIEFLEYKSVFSFFIALSNY